MGELCYEDAEGVMFEQRETGCRHARGSMVQGKIVLASENDRKREVGE